MKPKGFSGTLSEALDLSFRKMVEEKRKDNDLLAFEKNGKVFTIRARAFRFKDDWKIVLKKKKY